MSRAENKTTRSGADDKESVELELWRDGYSMRAFVPHLVVAAILTVVLVTIILTSIWHGAGVARFSAEAILVTGWLALTVYVVYRLVAIEYLLTTKRLFYRRDFRHPGDPGLDLEKIDEVRVDQTPIEKKLGVGRLRLQGTLSPHFPRTLHGVADPGRIASLLRKHLRRAQETDNKPAEGK